VYKNKNVDFWQYVGVIAPFQFYSCACFGALSLYGSCGGDIASLELQQLGSPSAGMAGAATIWGGARAVNGRIVTDIALERIQGHPEEFIHVSVVSGEQNTVRQSSISKDLSLIEGAAQYVPLAVQEAGKSKTYYVDVHNGLVHNMAAFRALFDPRHTGR
jgi:hypothetical protein